MFDIDAALARPPTPNSREDILKSVADLDSLDIAVRREANSLLARQLPIPFALGKPIKAEVLTELERRLPALLDDFTSGALSGVECHALRLVFQNSKGAPRERIEEVVRTGLGSRETSVNCVLFLFGANALMGAKSGALDILGHAVTTGTPQLRSVVLDGLCGMLDNPFGYGDTMSKFIRSTASVLLDSLHTSDSKQPAVRFIAKILSVGSEEDRDAVSSIVRSSFQGDRIRTGVDLLDFSAVLGASSSPDALAAVWRGIREHREDVVAGLTNGLSALFFGAFVGAYIGACRRSGRLDLAIEPIECLGAAITSFGLNGYEFLRVDDDRLMGHWSFTFDDPTVESALMANQIGNMAYLEMHREGSVRALRTNFGIRNFGRFPAHLLLDQLSLYDAPPDSPCEHLALIMAPWDHNGAFRDNENLIRTVHLQARDMDIPVIAYEVDSAWHALTALVDMKQIFGAHQMALITGHSSGSEVWFDEHSSFSTKQLQDPKVKRVLGELFTRSCTVLFDSCSVAAEKDSIIATLAEIFAESEVDFFGAQVPTSLKSITLYRDGEALRARAAYRRADAGVLVRCRAGEVRRILAVSSDVAPEST